MPQNSIEARIQERLQAFVKELDLLVRRGTLDSLRDVLGEGRPARAPRPRGRRRGKPSGSPVDGFTPRIAAHIRSNPGQTVGQIAQALGARASALKKAIKDMLAGKQVRKTGQRRGTRYFPPGPGRLPGRAVRKARKRRARRRRKAKAA